MSDVVTETTVVLEELLRDNEKLMLENKSLIDQISRMDKMFDILTTQFKELQKDRDSLKNDVKILMSVGKVN